MFLPFPAFCFLFFAFLPPLPYTFPLLFSPWWDACSRPHSTVLEYSVHSRHSRCQKRRKVQVQIGKGGKTFFANICDMIKLDSGLSESVAENGVPEG